MPGFCPNCGSMIREGASFCAKCGAKLAESSPAIAPEVTPAPAAAPAPVEPVPAVPVVEAVPAAEPVPAAAPVAEPTVPAAVALAVPVAEPAVPVAVAPAAPVAEPAVPAAAPVAEAVPAAVAPAAPAPAPVEPVAEPAVSAAAPVAEAVPAAVAPVAPAPAAAAMPVAPAVPVTPVTAPEPIAFEAPSGPLPSPETINVTTTEAPKKKGKGALIAILAAAGVVLIALISIGAVVLYNNVFGGNILERIERMEAADSSKEKCGKKCTLYDEDFGDYIIEARWWDYDDTMSKPGVYSKDTDVLALSIEVNDDAEEDVYYAYYYSKDKDFDKADLKEPVFEDVIGPTLYTSNNCIFYNVECDKSIKKGYYLVIVASDDSLKTPYIVAYAEVK